MRNIKCDIAIIGAGAFTGFFAAFLDEAGAAGKARIVAVDKLARPFRKIAASGNGRCNYSNMSVSGENYISLEPDRAFDKAAARMVECLDLKQFFERRLVPSRSDEYGRLFPFTNASRTVVETLENCLRRAKIAPLLSTACRGASAAKGGGFTLECQDVNTGERSSIHSEILIFACGGAAYPQLGTDGSSFSLIEGLGHSIAGPAPAICALETEGLRFAQLAGVKMEVRIRYGGFDRTGEMLLTDRGVSGPNVLYASGVVSRDLWRKEKPELTFDFLPGLDEFFFISGAAAAGAASLADVFSGSINRDFLRAFARSVAVDVSASADTGAITRLFLMLKSHRVRALRTRPFEEAQVSLGGVRCAEVRPDTLESLLVRGVFFGGEVLDFTGGCGGYNIHFAASCARTVVKSLFIK